MRKDIAAAPAEKVLMGKCREVGNRLVERVQFSGEIFIFIQVKTELILKACWTGEGRLLSNVDSVVILFLG